MDQTDTLLLSCGNHSVFSSSIHGDWGIVSILCIKLLSISHTNQSKIHEYLILRD